MKARCTAHGKGFGDHQRGGTMCIAVMCEAQLTDEFVVSMIARINIDDDVEENRKTTKAFQ